MESLDALEYVAVGKSGTVYGIDEHKVIKEYDDQLSSHTERLAYERLGTHPNIAKCIETLQDGRLVIERGIVLRRKHYEYCTIPIHRKVEWLIQAATAVAYIHDKNILQADVGCHNMIIKDGILKLIDFEGCSIDNGPATSAYEWFSYRRSDPSVTRSTDIFAFGCAIYELIVGHPPYYEFLSRPDRTTIVEELYLRDQFPDVQHLPLGEIITGCWRSSFTQMNEVVYALLKRKKKMLRGKVAVIFDACLRIVTCRIAKMYFDGS